MNATATHKEITMHENDHDDVQHETFTAMVCEQAALFGAKPGPDEFDNPPRLGRGRGNSRRHQGLRRTRRGRTRRHATRG